MNLIIYTTDVGGHFKAIMPASWEDYEEILKTGRLQELPTVDRHPGTPVKFAAFGSVSHNFDFVLKRPR